MNSSKIFEIQEEVYYWVIITCIMVVFLNISLYLTVLQNLTIKDTVISERAFNEPLFLKNSYINRLELTVNKKNQVIIEIEEKKHDLNVQFLFLK